MNFNHFLFNRPVFSQTLDNQCNKFHFNRLSPVPLLRENYWFSRKSGTGRFNFAFII